MKLGRSFAAALAFLVLSPATAYAGQFNFTVPVELTNMPAATQRGYVRCIVSQVTPTTPPLNIGEGRSAEFTITDGRFSGNVLVEVNAGSSFSPAQANRYSCMLWLHVRRADGSGGFYSAYALGQPTGPVEGRLLYSASRRGDVAEGDIPAS
jgi:hypothetical protein